MIQIEQKYIQKRSTTSNYNLNYPLPKPLQNIFNKVTDRRTLGTDSLSVARLKRDVIVAQYKQALLKIKEANDTLQSLTNLSLEPALNIETEPTKVLSKSVSIAKQPQFEMIDVDTTTMFKASEVFLKDKGHKWSERELVNKQNYVTKFISFCKSTRTTTRLKQITIQQVQQYIESCREQGKSSATIANYINTLANIWEHHDWLNPMFIKNPFRGHDIKRKTDRVKSYVPFSLDDWKLIQKQLSEDDVPYQRKVIPLILLFTGMRLNECCGLLTKDILEENGIKYLNIYHNGVRTIKTRNSIRKIPIAEKLLPVFDRLVKESKQGRLFPLEYKKDLATSEKYSNFFSKRKAKTSIKDTEIGRKAVHSFRGMFDTALVNTKTIEQQINYIMGHKGASMSTNTYSDGLYIRTSKEVVESAFENLADYINNCHC